MEKNDKLRQTILNILNELVLQEGIVVVQRVSNMIDMLKNDDFEFENEDLDLICKGLGYALVKYGIRGANFLQVLEIFNKGENQESKS